MALTLIDEVGNVANHGMFLILAILNLVQQNLGRIGARLVRVKLILDNLRRLSDSHT